MNQTQIVILFLVFLVFGFWLFFYLFDKKIQQIKNSDLANYLKKDVGDLNRSVYDLQKIINERLDKNNSLMQNSMQRQLGESAKLVADVTHRLTKLDETNRQVVDVANELKTLQNILGNPKQRGVFGEYYLESVLQNILPSKNYKMQYKFNDGQIVDAVIFLDKNKILPIDSKFSLENYNRMLSESNKIEKSQLLKKIRGDLKSRIDETSKYIRSSENTMDFAFMFIPSEALYYDLLIGEVGDGVSSRDLIEYAFRDRRVIIVSPTSFMAYLQTVMQGLRSLQIEEQAKEIQARVGKLGSHLSQVDSYMNKLGKSISLTVGVYNDAYLEFQKVDRDVVKIAGVEKSINPLQIDKPKTDQ